MSVFDLVARSALVLTELLWDLLGGAREPAKPPADSIITATAAGSLSPHCWGFVAGIEALLACTPHTLGGGGITAEGDLIKSHVINDRGTQPECQLLKQHS